MLLAYFDHQKTQFFLDKCSGVNPLITDTTSVRKRILCHIHFKEKKSGHESIISDLLKNRIIFSKTVANHQCVV